MVLAGCPQLQQRDASPPFTICDGYFSRANERLQGVVRQQRASAFYYRKVGQSQQLSASPHLFQPPRFAPLRKLSAIARSPYQGHRQFWGLCWSRLSCYRFHIALSVMLSCVVVVETTWFYRLQSLFWNSAPDLFIHPFCMINKLFLLQKDIYEINDFLFNLALKIPIYFAAKPLNNYFIFSKSVCIQWVQYKSSIFNLYWWKVCQVIYIISSDYKIQVIGMASGRKKNAK